MAFNRFGIGLVWRVGLLVLAIFTLVYLVFFDSKYVTTAITAIMVVVLTASLYQYVNVTNRKLTRFLDAIKNADFVLGFQKDKKLGNSFMALNAAFERVLEVYRQTRAENEESLQYLDVVVQHVGVGLLAYDNAGKVTLLNQAARDLLQLRDLLRVSDLHRKHAALHEALGTLEPGHKTMVPLRQGVVLAVQMTRLKLRGHNYQLVSLQNIIAELQNREVDAWQNLTRVLRHEIMNSVAPISTLVSALKDIVEEEREQHPELLGNDNYEDLHEGLLTIENRTRALIRFVDAYRSYNDIPKPKFASLTLKPLLDKVYQLIAPQLEAQGIRIDYEVPAEHALLTFQGDGELLEQVLINLLKNAAEAASTQPAPLIGLHGGVEHGRLTITVTDNGPGIAPNDRERIFIPFYTTKKEGTGIGLSLSRQIIQQHGGGIFVTSEPHQATTFIIKL